MYKLVKSVTVSDDVIHRYSLQEWEELLLRRGDLQRDECPLSFSKVAEIIAWDLMRYGHYWAVEDDTQWKVTEDLIYTDCRGNSFDPRIRPHAGMGDPPQQHKISTVIDPGPMVTGIATYGRKY